MALTALAVLLVRSDEATLDDLEIDEQGKLDLSGNAVDRYASAARLLRPSPRRAPLLFLLLLSDCPGPAAALGLISSPARRPQVEDCTNLAELNKAVILVQAIFSSGTIIDLATQTRFVKACACVRVPSPRIASRTPPPPPPLSYSRSCCCC